METNINQLWVLCDPLTVQQAACLIAGYDPNNVAFNDYDEPYYSGLASELPGQDIGWVKTAYAAVVNAVNAGKLPAMVRRDARLLGWDEFPNVGENIRSISLKPEDQTFGDNEATVIYCEAPDWSKTTIDREELISWLQQKGFNSGFFFPDTSLGKPDYFNPQHPQYAPKLAAAIKAWQAVTSDPRYQDNGKHVKQNLEDWLTAHAAELGLIKEDGGINSDAIKNQIAKVANWQDKGGAPKTPGG